MKGHQMVKSKKSTKSLHPNPYPGTHATPPPQLGMTVFGIFLVSRKTKLYETGHCFAKFRSFRETEKNTKKSVSSFFAQQQNNVSFRIFVYFC